MLELACSAELVALWDTLKSEPSLLIRPISAFRHCNDPLPLVLILHFCAFSYAYYKSKFKHSLRDVSFVERIRGGVASVSALLICAHHYFHRGHSPHLYIATLLILIWAVRITFNLWLKGGFVIERGEDQRWSVVRHKIRKPLQWNIFVFAIVHCYQIASLFAYASAPLYIIYWSAPQRVSSNQSLALCALYLLFAIFLSIESVADYQMWRFQILKASQIHSSQILFAKQNLIIEENMDYYGWKFDFHATGLRYYCRFPHYCAEMGLWLVVALIAGVFTGFDTLNWSVLGAFNLGFILYRVASLSEQIWSFKYGAYTGYMQRTNRFLPWFPKEKEN